MGAEIIDQFLHFLWAFCALAPVLWKPRVWTAVLSALIIALPREFVDQWYGWPPGFWKLLDVFFFALGGFAVGLMFHKFIARP